MTGPPEPSGRVWSRRLQTSSALLLMGAPALPWAHFPIVGHVVWLPGVFFHGLLVMGVGVVALVCSLLRRPWSGVKTCLGLIALGILLWDATVIGGRTEYQLDRLQLWIAETTGFLNYLGWHPPVLVPTGWKAAAFIGEGLWISIGGAMMLSLAGVGEAMSYGRTRPWLGVLLGRPACGQCRARVGLDMGFCPGCGARFSEGRQCRRCAAWMREGDRFCSTCGCGFPAQLEGGDKDGIGDRHHSQE